MENITNNRKQKKAEKAYYLLEHPEKYPGLPTRNKFDRRLLLYRYPSFESSVSWSIFKTNKVYWIRRVKWNYYKLSFSQNLEPFTLGSENVLSPDLVETIFFTRSSVKLSSLKESDIIGIDGTIYGIKIENCPFPFSLQWWCLPSNEWKPLADWFDKTVNIFEQVLPNSTYSHR